MHSLHLLKPSSGPESSLRWADSGPGALCLTRRWKCCRELVWFFSLLLACSVVDLRGHLRLLDRSRCFSVQLTCEHVVIVFLYLLQKAHCPFYLVRPLTAVQYLNYLIFNSLFVDFVKCIVLFS